MYIEIFTQDSKTKKQVAAWNLYCVTLFLQKKKCMRRSHTFVLLQYTLSHSYTHIEKAWKITNKWLTLIVLEGGEFKLKGLHFYH